MKHFIVWGACALLLLSTTTQAQFSNYTFKPSVFETEIKNRFKGVKGYSVALLKKGQLYKTVNGGFRVEDSNAKYPMFSHIYGDFGSVQKFVSGILLLRIFERIRTEKSVDQWLNTRVYNYFPARVRAKVPSINRKITFGDLLRHKSGIRGGENSNVYKNFFTAIKNENYGVRSYNNINYKVLTYLIPALYNKNLLSIIDSQANAFNWSYDSKAFVDSIGPQFTTIIKKEIFDRTTPTMFGTCSPNKDLIAKGKGIAKMYSLKVDPYPGVVDKDPAKHCVAQGGWYYSAKDMAILLANLYATDRIINRSLYNDLYDVYGNSFERDNRLLYNREIISPFLTNASGWKGFPTHGGTMNRKRNYVVHDAKYKNGSSRAAIIRFPGGYTGVAHCNSSELSSTQVAEELKNAFGIALQ